MILFNGVNVRSMCDDVDKERWNVKTLNSGQVDQWTVDGGRWKVWTIALK